ncbi:low molecular weight protein-tyrosine-phosphatase [Parasphingopyxis lamellibrachiae]|uniref:protein-tyrosine-phosphatase n=1 Tax=Parasphingopyxis lamellibrachiae TaxID=680125 RepID=A0A3D9FFX8_9SPHN|nr:low molecular weight protein-tyrosine-phosphatase [Parasphingopyxis lamellibrachiae]RED16016.1 protein-tyrosine phosphatase [Parasphingopyxis lamellibrachiae]
MPHSILFVCLGNICRSPMAEGAMRHVSEQRGMDIVVDSAGTGSWHVGDAPDRRARAAALASGVDISGQQARLIAAQDFDRFDQVIAMDRSVFGDLASLRPGTATAALSLFFDHVAGREGQDVADPYYGEEADFAASWAEIMAGAVALLERLGRGSAL